jgi:hypothetical protein
MLIHGVTKKGDPIKMSAKEALAHVVVRAVAKQNTADCIYLPKQDTVVVDGAINVADKGDGEWHASAQGHVMVGKTLTKCGTTCVDKKYSFDIRFYSDKDDLGVPDVLIESAVVEPFVAVDVGAVAEPAEAN